VTAGLLNPNVTGQLPDFNICFHSDCATGDGNGENVEINLSLLANIFQRKFRNNFLQIIIIFSLI